MSVGLIILFFLCFICFEREINVNHGKKSNNSFSY